MTEDFGAPRVSLRSPDVEDNAAAAYQQVAENRAAAEAADWLRSITEETPSPAGTTKTAGSGNADLDALIGATEETPQAGQPAGNAPASGEQPAAEPDFQGYAPVKEGENGLASSVVEWMGAAATAAGAVTKDVGVGLTEAPGQVVGGVIDALGEMDQFMQELIPIGGAQLFNDAGEFDPSLTSAEDMAANNKAGEDLFAMLAPADADTVTGGFVRATAQFLTGFVPGLQATKGMTAVRGGAYLSNMAAGALADMIVFDPNEDRLSTLLNEIPALGSVVPDYLADNSPDQAAWEGRLKNAIEGIGLGLATDGLLSAFKYYKAARKAKATTKAAADPVGATVEAAKDTLKQTARAELVQEIPDEALRPLGDTTGPALIQAAPDETAAAAFDRLAGARVRAEASDVNRAALDKINEVRTSFAARKKIDPELGRDPMDEMLDELRSGAVTNAKIPKRPVAEIVKALGGVDPASSLAADMRSRGITSKAFPGLYRKGGRGALDNVPASEIPLMNERGAIDAATGYVDQQAFIDGLEAELKGTPWMTGENQRAFDEIISPLDDLEMELDRLGINYNEMSNESIKARIQAIADEEAIYQRDLGKGALFESTRTLEDIEREAADELAAMRRETGGYVIDEVFEWGGAKIADPVAFKNTVVPTLEKFGQRIRPKDLPLQQENQWAYVIDESGKVYRLNDDIHEKLFDALGKNAGEGVEAEEIAKQSGLAIFRLSRGKNGIAGGIDFHSKPTAKQTQAFKQIKAALGGAEDLFSVSAWREKGATISGASAPKEPKVYFNYARMNTAEDVKGALKEMLDLDAANIKEKTRGVVTNEQTIRESSKEYRDLNDLLGRAPGPMNAAQATAARRLLASSSEQIVQLAKKAEGAGATPADLFNFRRAMAVHYALQSEVVAARTETARALQAWSIPVGASKARSQAISELIATSGGSGDIQALAKAVSVVGDNPTAINTMARELGRGRFGKALYQVWINGLLSSPKTHVVNVTSNAMVAMYSIPERYVASGISKAFYNGDIQAGEASAQIYGMMKGIRDGARLVYMGNKAEAASGVGDVFDAFVKAEGVHTNAISAEAFGLNPKGSIGWGIDMMSKFVNAPGSALNAEDKFFKTIGYRMELQAQAYRQAATEGLEGKDLADRVASIVLNPPDNIKADALDAAHYQTFTQPLGKIGQAGQLLLGRIPGARLVVPFVKTPTNILKWTFARTPLAYAMSSIKADVAAGGARAAQAHARVALGSLIMLTVIDMSAEGTITGRGPDDPAMRKVKMQTGWQPYSIKVGNRWYQYNRTDPIAMIVGLGADMSEIFANVDGVAAEEMAMAGVVALANNLSSKTYMSGIFDFIGAMDSNNPTSSPGKYLQDFAGGLVPYSSFLRNASYAMTPEMKESKTVVYGDDNKVDAVATWLDNTVNNYRKQIPGQSAEMPPMRDLWGEPITRASEIGWAWDFLSPVASRVDNPDPVTQVILDNRIDVSFPPRTINGVKLDNAQFSEFSEIAGKGAKEYLDQFVASPGFKQMSDGPDGMKAENLKNIINTFRDQARKIMLARHPELRERVFRNEQERQTSLTGQ